MNFFVMDSFAQRASLISGLYFVLFLPSTLFIIAALGQLPSLAFFLMQGKLYMVYFWLSSVLFVLMCVYLISKYVLAVQNRPRIQKSDILFQEWFASGSSLKNILTRFGGARNCLRLVVTKDLLSVTSWFPFSLFAPFYDLEHVTLLNRITNIEPGERFMGREVRLTYTDTNDNSHSLRLIPKDAEGFLRAIQDNNRGEKANNSFNRRVN